MAIRTFFRRLGAGTVEKRRHFDLGFFVGSLLPFVYGVHYFVVAGSGRITNEESSIGHEPMFLINIYAAIGDFDWLGLWMPNFVACKVWIVQCHGYIFRDRSNVDGRSCFLAISAAYNRAVGGKTRDIVGIN